MKMKKAIALLATAGMLTSPLAMAQNAVSPAPGNDDRPAGAVQAGDKDIPKSGGSSGLARSLGVSDTVLAIGIASALAVGIGFAVSSSSSSSSTGTN